MIKVDIVSGEVLENNYWKAMHENSIPLDFEQRMKKNWDRHVYLEQRGINQKKHTSLIDYYEAYSKKATFCRRKGLSFNELKRIIALKKSRASLQTIASKLNRNFNTIKKHVSLMRKAGIIA